MLTRVCWIQCSYHYQRYIQRKVSKRKQIWTFALKMQFFLQSLSSQYLFSCSRPSFSNKKNVASYLANSRSNAFKHLLWPRRSNTKQAWPSTERSTVQKLKYSRKGQADRTPLKSTCVDWMFSVPTTKPIMRLLSLVW